MFYNLKDQWLSIIIQNFVSHLSMMVLRKKSPCEDREQASTKITELYAPQIVCPNIYFIFIS
ncbi:hypothetical protein pb186bvf_010114 [Paramecium bursaria]